MVAKKRRVGESCAVKQPFQCTHTNEEGKPFPYYQTVRCVSSMQGAPPVIVDDDVVNDDWLPC